MVIKSTVFENGGRIPVIYTCDGKNINPPLYFIDVPAETITLALVMDDPDAPNGTFDHWLIWNISSDVMGIEEDAPLLGVNYGNNGFGFAAYGGPCPPKGEEHRYYFRLYALRKRLDIGAVETSKAELMNEINKYTIAKAELIGKYSREA